MEKNPAPSGCKKPTPGPEAVLVRRRCRRPLARQDDEAKEGRCHGQGGRGTEVFIVEKPIRGGEQVLSAPVTRFTALVSEEEDAAAEEAQAIDGVAA